MNKQELIEAITKKASNKFSPSGYYNLALGEMLQLIEQLDELQKEIIKVPKEFDDWYSDIKERYKRLEVAKKFAVWKICQFGFGHGFEDVNGCRVSGPISHWVSMHHEDAMNAVLNGYEIEEPEEWVVKVKRMYFLNWGEDGTCPTFVLDDNPRAKLQAKPFIKSEGQALAESLKGSIEKV